MTLFLLLLHDELNWTEYTLYWTFACLSGMAAQLHTTSESLRLYSENGFDWGAWRGWRADAAFGDSSFVFSVLQSIGGVSPKWVEEQLEPFLN